MPPRWISRGIWSLGVVIVAGILAIAALPYIASTQIVRDRIAIEMSAWSGYRVDLGGAPMIKLWPFRAILNNVTLSDWSDPEQTPVMRVERVEIELSALAALSGNVVFSTARLIRPALRVSPVGERLFLPARPAGGRISRSIETARALVKDNPLEPDLKSLPDAPFGKVEFTDGRVTVERGGKVEEIVSSIAGIVSWPALNRSAVLSSKGIWRGETVALDMTVENPLILFAGGTAPLSLNFKAPPASLAFDGTANLSGDAYFAGSATFASPSLRRMLEWSTEASSTDTTIGAVALSGNIAGNDRNLKFEDADVTLDGNSGMGVLNIAIGDQVPAISGSLAFDTLDLRWFLSALTPLQPDGIVGSIDTAFSDRVNLDLRLSAASATAGTVALSGLAATAQIKPGLAAFDISDATAFGGSIQAGIRFDRKVDGNLVEIRLLASDIDGAALAAASPTTLTVPTGRGTVSIILKGQGASWQELLEKGDGSVSATFGQGVIPNFDLKSFRDNIDQAKFFALADVRQGELPVNAVDLKATVAKGVTRIEKAEVKAENYTMSLSGIVPYVGGGLALSGVIVPRKADAGGDSNGNNFFIGGSWNAPFVAPVFQGIPRKTIQ